MEDETKTLAEMVAERKKTPRPRKLKVEAKGDCKNSLGDEGHGVPTNLWSKTDTEVAKLTPILMSKVGQACKERDATKRSLDYAKQTLHKNNNKQVETFGRLYKHEGEPIIQETLDYAEKNGLFIQCESRFIGIYTRVSPVEKGGKIYHAHFTHYNRNLKKAKKGDVPESYKGNFLYKEFKPQFDAILKKSPKSFTCLEDLFKLTDGSPI
jgi:hypothetical protein